jgi:hypothetical protein
VTVEPIVNAEESGRRVCRLTIGAETLDDIHEGRNASKTPARNPV